MNKSEIRGKHDADATKLHRESLPTSHTYKRDPPGGANGGATQYAYKERVQGLYVSVPEEDAPGGTLPGVGRRSVDPGLHPVQVHLEEEWLSRHLITFYM